MIDFDKPVLTRDGRKMDKDTLKALKGSIKKWKDIAEGKGDDQGDINCPLCLLFIGGGCDGCPVTDENSDFEVCSDTPFDEWRDHHSIVHGDRWSDSYRVKCPECKEIALKEVAFLESLLPEKKDG